MCVFSPVINLYNVDCDDITCTISDKYNLTNLAKQYTFCDHPRLSHVSMFLLCPGNFLLQ